jgi:Cap4 dsDNA endonuclease
MNDVEPSPTTAQEVWPSIDDTTPSEEGGPNARKGFNYQDEIAVGFLIQMLEDENLCRIHCETHDDLILVWSQQHAAGDLAEYVQVKALEPDKLWSVADLCRPKSVAGTSIFEISLSRDRHKEIARFRVVTLRSVVQALVPLTFACGSAGREAGSEGIKALRGELDTRCPGAISPKGNCHDYWLEHCRWDVRHDQETVCNDNRRRLLQLSVKAGAPLLLEQLEVILDELRAWAKAAGDARWVPNKAKKIISRATMEAWWTARLAEIAEGRASASGGKLAAKLKAAALPDEVIGLAIELRRDYAAAVRTTRYMEPRDMEVLQGHVKSEAMSLRARHVAGQIALDGVAFHALCLERMDAINAARGIAADGFLKGCLYDIADRCLLRFERPAS